MLLPTLQHGNWKDVRPRVKAVLRRLKRGEDFLKVVAEDGMLNTETTDGMLIVGGTMRSGPTNFHCHEPWKHLGDTIAGDESGRALEEQIFRSSLTVPWGVLGLMTPACTLWLRGGSIGANRSSASCWKRGTRLTLSDRATSLPSRASVCGRSPTASTTFSLDWAFPVSVSASRCRRAAPQRCSSTRAWRAE